MTHKERILAVFRGERPDVMPWFADLTYWYSVAVSQGTLPEKYQDEGVVQLYRDLGCGCHEHALGTPYHIQHPAVETRVDREKDGNGLPYRERIEWHTPVGTLTELRQYEPESCSWAYLEYPVKTPKDLQSLRFIYESQQVVPDYADQIEQIEMWCDTAAASSIPPRSPLAELIVTWMGVINTVYALHDAPAEVEATLEVMAQSDDPIYEAIENSPAPLVYFGENITGEVVSPKLFQKYYAPYYLKRTRGLHAKGKYIFVHIDGTMRGVLPLIAASGVDCAQSLTPAPLGDVSIQEMRTLAGDELILWAGIPGVYFSRLYPAKAVRDMVMDYMKYLKGDPRFILGVCDQVPPDGEIDRVRMISDLVEQYGRYE